MWSIFLVLGTAGAFLVRSEPDRPCSAGLCRGRIGDDAAAGSGEEYLFRGLLLQALGATRLPVWVCCVGSGALFAAAHLQFDAPLFADRLLLGTVLAWLAIRTGGIEAGIAVHAVKNVAVLIPAGLLDDVSDALDPSGVTWLPVIVDAVLLSIAIPWMVAAHRRSGHTSEGRGVPQPSTPPEEGTHKCPNPTSAECAPCSTSDRGCITATRRSIHLLSVRA
ncbi:MAG: CPBP family intramembrane glutamic endopeptidase [Nocardioidaceae bacterium]